MSPNASNDNSSLAEQVRQTNRLFVGLAVLTLTMICGGAIFYHFVEHLKWLDSFYFCVVTLATVGYGDITPKTDPGKLFTIFYILVGVGIIAAFASTLLRRAILRRQYSRSLKGK